MKALIIAAGKGSRLNDLTMDKPKALAQLLGLTLIERIILTAKQACIDDFIIVTGFRGGKIKEKLGDGERYGVKITYIENNDWKKGNGVSVLSAKELLDEPFILLMSDHIFEHRILEDLRETKFEGDECFLCVDKAPAQYIDMEDATKVKIENDRIIDIGKELKEYDAVDCGIFLLSPIVFEALKGSIKEGDETLSGGIRTLAGRGKMKPFDIKDGFWIDIDTKVNYENAEKILCKRLVKPSDGPVSLLLNRLVSIRISKPLLKTKIIPDAISVISFGIAVISAFFFSLGDYLNVIVGGLLAQFSSIVDGCDGEVARLKFQQTNYGGWFDAVLDRYADALIILGMTYGCRHLNRDIEIWLVGFIALVGSFMNSYTADRYDAAFRKKIKTTGFRIRIGRDVRLFLIMTGALFNQVFYTLIIIGILTNIESIRRLICLKEKHPIIGAN